MSLESDIKSLVNSMDMELYDITTTSEFDETIYRISVVSNEVENGKRKPVSLDACAELSHMISPLLDTNPPVSGEYRLEVGSPGIERKLKTIEQFELSIGEKVNVTLKEKEKIKGTLLRVEGSQLFIDVEGVDEVVDFADVAKAKTYFEW